MSDWWERIGPDKRTLLAFLVCASPAWIGLIALLLVAVAS